MAVNTLGQDITQAGGSIVPVAQTPVTPVPQIQTPAVNPVQNQALTTPQTPATVVNVNQPAPAEPPKQAEPKTQPVGTSLTPPANGSVVDLLNSAGQDSSLAAREQLAQKYGIQGYTGTAAQNQDLSKKFIDAFNANKGTAVPQNSAAASSALDSYFTNNQQQVQQDPTKSFMDIYGSMNPVESSIFQQLSGLLSTQNVQTSLADTYAQLSKQQGIPDLNLQLADINKIMAGTEDDIRAEITNAGGLATESQVQALTGARNKTLINQANYLQNTINAKNDYVDRIVSLTQADRAQVSKDLDQKLGIANTLVTMSNNMENAARSNYQNIVNSVGWAGLAQSVAGNPTQTANIEKIMGLQPGELQALSTIKKPLTEMEQAQLSGQLLQNKKLQQDLNTGPAVSTTLQNFGTPASPHYKLINSKTGATIADYGSSVPSGGGQQQLALQQQNITDISGLLTNPSLGAAVGPNLFSRGGFVSIPATYGGGVSNFISGVQQLQQQLTLNNLQSAKQNGATFGALSDSELGLLSQSASKIGSWAIKDKNSNVIGYNVDEGSFKKELDRINNFQKLDYVLKGGDPSSVGIQQQADGTFWTKNSDGTYTQIQ